jgi:hypothetical protein
MRVPDYNVRTDSSLTVPLVVQKNDATPPDGRLVGKPSRVRKSEPGRFTVEVFGWQGATREQPGGL